MLILTRRIGEGIAISDNVNVVILSIKEGKVRVGIQAPREVLVHRDEIYALIQAEKVTVAANTPKQP